MKTQPIDRNHKLLVQLVDKTKPVRTDSKGIKWLTTKWYEVAEKPIYIDLGEVEGLKQFNPRYVEMFNNKIFEVKKIYPKIPCGGWGKLITKEELRNRKIPRY